MFTRTCQRCLSCAMSLQFPTFHPITLRPISVLFSYLPLGLSISLVPSGFPTKTRYAFLVSPMLGAYPAFIILLYLVTLIYYFVAYRIFYFLSLLLLDLTIHIRTLFLNTLNLFPLFPLDLFNSIPFVLSSSERSPRFKFYKQQMEIIWLITVSWV
jgi:hypothetical protein